MTSSDPQSGTAGQPPSVVADLMDASPPTVRADTRVGDIARLLLDRNLSGVPVVNDAGEVVGLVTQSDLVTRHAHVHFPFYLNILGGVIPLRGEHRFQQEMRRVTGRTAADVMTTEVVTVGPDTPLDDVATLLAEEGHNPLPVLRGRRLVGLISRADLVRLVVVEEDARG
jgi:CBS domain-containing protein